MDEHVKADWRHCREPMPAAASSGSLCSSSECAAVALAELRHAPSSDPTKATRTVASSRRFVRPRGHRRRSSLWSGCTEVRCDRLDGRTLVGADGLSAFPVSVGDLVGGVEDEALVVVELLGCGLALEQFDRIAKMLQAVFFDLLGRVVAGAVDLGLC